MNNWVILFVRTGTEKKVASILKEKLDADEYFPFLPVKETYYRNRAVDNKVHRLLFPSYVFIKTGIEAKSVSGKLKSAFENIGWPDDIIKILHYGSNKDDVVMREKERLRWESLLDPNYCVTGSVGVIEGDMIKIISGALIGKEGWIKKINRHKREAIVEMEMMGGVGMVKLMLEVIAKC